MEKTIIQVECQLEWIPVKRPVFQGPSSSVSLLVFDDIMMLVSLACPNMSLKSAKHSCVHL